MLGLSKRENKISKRNIALNSIQIKQSIDCHRHTLTWCGGVFVVRSESHCSDAKWASLGSRGPLQQLQGTARVIICTDRGRHFFFSAEPLMVGDKRRETDKSLD